MFKKFRNEDASSWVSVSSPTPDINIEITPETPTAPKRKATNRESHMAKAKELWGSDEQEDDILDRFLKAKRFQVLLKTYCLIYRPPLKRPKTPKYSYSIFVIKNV